MVLVNRNWVFSESEFQWNWCWTIFLQCHERAIFSPSSSVSIMCTKSSFHTKVWGGNERTQPFIVNGRKLHKNCFRKKLPFLESFLSPKFLALNTPPPAPGPHLPILLTLGDPIHRSVKLVSNISDKLRKNLRIAMKIRNLHNQCKAVAWRV